MTLLPKAKITETTYGRVTRIEHSPVVMIEATTDQLRAWAHRPGSYWPCSTLARTGGIEATFKGGDLIDLCYPNGEPAEEIMGDEFDSWAADVLA